MSRLLAHAGSRGEVEEGGGGGRLNCGDPSFKISLLLCESPAWDLIIIAWP